MPEADDVVGASRESIARGSSSFEAASRLFDRAVREDAWLLYAWCRHCDDEIDGQDHGGEGVGLTTAERRARLERLRRLTRAALAGEAQDQPAFAAFQRVAARHALPEAWPLELLDGFALDVEPPRLAALDDTLRYCWGVAGVVGVMMARIMGAADPAVLRRAQDLGLAFQITNICRDIAEDARADRVYLPADRLAAVGVPPTPAALLDPANRAAVFAVATDLLVLAEAYYESARIGLRALPLRSALAIAAARAVYREIGRRILRRGPGALASRMATPRPVMAWLVVRSMATALLSRLESRRRPPPRPDLWSRL